MTVCWESLHRMKSDFTNYIFHSNGHTRSICTHSLCSSCLLLVVLIHFCAHRVQNKHPWMTIANKNLACWVNNMKLPTSWPFSEAMSIINTARAQYLQDYIHNLQHGLELLTALMKLLTHNKNIKCIYFHENLILCIKLTGVLPPLYDEIQKIS